MVKLIESKVPTITFVRARVVAELIYKYAVESLQRNSPSLAKKIKPYRGEDTFLVNEGRSKGSFSRENCWEW